MKQNDDGYKKDNTDINTNINKALLSVKETCAYLGIGETKIRELMSDPHNGFTIKIGNRLYAHKEQLDKWLKKQILK